MLKYISTLLFELDFWWNLKIGRHHWFQVRYSYNKNGSQIFNWTSQIGVSDKRTILNFREIKTIPTPLHKMSGLAKSNLCNGTLDVEILCYLGRLSNKPIKTK